MLEIISHELLSGIKKNAKNLIRKNYHEISSGFLGWHQFLGGEKIGNIATAQALYVLSKEKKIVEICENAKKTLYQKQCKKVGDSYFGGWTYTTNSCDYPTTEPTAWVLYSLLSSKKNCVTLQPVLTKGLNWIKKNHSLKQGEKYGWGSTKNSEPRVYTTVLVLKVLNLLCKHSDYYRFGLRWLQEAINPDGGWGEASNTKSKILHTSHVILLYDELGIEIEESTKQYLKNELKKIKNINYIDIEVLDIITPDKNFKDQRELYKHFVYPYALAALFLISKSIPLDTFRKMKQLLLSNKQGYLVDEFQKTKKKYLWSIFDLLFFINKFEDYYSCSSEKSIIISLFGKNKKISNKFLRKIFEFLEKVKLKNIYVFFVVATLVFLLLLWFKNKNYIVNFIISAFIGKLIDRFFDFCKNNK